MKLLGDQEQLVEAAGRSGAIGLSYWEVRSNWLKLLGGQEGDCSGAIGLSYWEVRSNWLKLLVGQEQLVEAAGRSGAID